MPEFCNLPQLPINFGVAQGKYQHSCDQHVTWRPLNVKDGTVELEFFTGVVSLPGCKDEGLQTNWHMQLQQIAAQDH